MPIKGPKEDLVNKIFNEWRVISYAGKGTWLCRCSCGTERIIQGTHLKTGRTKNCGHNAKNKKVDLTGQTIGEWKVLEQAPSGTHRETQWLCQCSCGEIRVVTSNALRNGRSTSCGHSTTGLHDITGKTFGNWKVLHKSNIKISGGSTLWTCECKCGTVKDVGYYALVNGLSKSCGCMANTIREETVENKYGVKHAAQIGTKRTEEQLEAISDADKLANYIKNNFDYTPSSIELAEKLGISRGTLNNHLAKKGLTSLVSNYKSDISGYEKALKAMYPCNNVNNREILNGKEIDLYYPELDLGIEFNGNYWHSDLKKKESKYHQEKTLIAISKGIRLIHIFEYEWNDQRKRKIILDIISSLYYGDRVRSIYARNCSIAQISNADAKEFLGKTHIQGYVPAKVNLALFYEGKIVEIMTFGEPRFNKEYDWELLRLSSELSTKVIGGASKLFKYFVDNYNPSNLLSYCDMSKFTGSVYKTLGFKFEKVTEPNYAWINLETLDVKTRYQTTKSNLVNSGLGDISQTEDEIMKSLGYVKIYDCGNFKFTWHKGDKAG